MERQGVSQRSRLRNQPRDRRTEENMCEMGLVTVMDRRPAMQMRKPKTPCEESSTGQSREGARFQSETRCGRIPTVMADPTRNVLSSAAFPRRRGAQFQTSPIMIYRTDRVASAIEGDNSSREEPARQLTRTGKRRMAEPRFVR
jgi:hypothetical protein